VHLVGSYYTEMHSLRYNYSNAVIRAYENITVIMLVTL